MKRRILFVDDEPNILKGLKRVLRPLRQKWDMHFTNSGRSALGLLADSNFDVIVTDMRMPEMDGSQLLRIVQETYPMMVRIVLSGQSDREMIMKSVKSAHQYLSKPCEKGLLIDAVTRACSLRDFLTRKSVKYVLGGIDTMPGLPALYTRIMAELRSKEASSQSVGEIISRDVGMSAKVLQLVNSSFFGMPCHVASPSEAVVLLGIDVVKTLVLTIEVFSRFRQKTLRILPVARINDHSYKTGIVAGKIAGAQKMSKKEADNAMIAGMLHDLGKLLLAEHYPDEYEEVVAQVKEKRIPFHQAELEVLGVTHAEIGGYLLSIWGLPDPVVEGVAFHHMPDRCIVEGFGLCGIVHVANLMEKHERLRPGGWDRLNGVNLKYLKNLGLEERIPLWRDSLNV